MNPNQIGQLLSALSTLPPASARALLLDFADGFALSLGVDACGLSTAAFEQVARDAAQFALSDDKSVAARQLLPRGQQRSLTSASRV